LPPSKKNTTGILFPLDPRPPLCKINEIQKEKYFPQPRKQTSTSKNTMKKIFQTFIAMTLVSLGSASANVTIFKTINSSEMNLGWIQVYDLPSEGGAFQFGGASPLANLVASFSTPTELTMTPNNTITDPSAFWYSQPGDVGNKVITSILYASATRGSLLGDTLSLEFVVPNYSLSTNSVGNPYTFLAIIQEWGVTYKDVSLPISSTGSYSLSMPLLVDQNTLYQWGFVMTGPNISPSNVEEFEVAGSVTIEAIPEPSTYALLGLAAAGGLLVRRFRRKA
jgi:hypothetical protein